MLITLTALCALLCMRKLRPKMVESIFAPFDSSVQPATVQAEASARDLVEERAFNEFLVAFKAGPLPLMGEGQMPGAKQGQVEESEPAKRKPEVEALKGFFAPERERLLTMRHLLQEIGRDFAQSSQQGKAGELRDQLIALRDRTSRPELLPIWQVASAAGSLAGQLANRNGAITPSSLRTIASGLDLLVELCREGLDPKLSSEPPIRLLAVDDDLLSRHAVALSLKKAYNQPDIASNGEAALAQASLIAYDVIFLDVQMPHMDGFELCKKIRQTSLNGTTPIVFVTCHSELEARAESNLSGGTDLIGKPFLTFELTVKALVLTLRARLEKRKKAASRPAAPALCPAPALAIQREQAKLASA
jgi:CheY-like chemotaxis protein